MKKILICLILVLTIYTPMICNCEENPKDIMNSQVEALNIGEINDSINRMVSPESSEIIPKLDLKKLLNDLAMGKVSFNIKDILNNLVKFFFGEIKTNLDIIVKIIVIVLVCSLLQNLQNSFGSNGVGEIAFYACYILIATLMIKGFMDILNMSKAVVENMVLFMQMLIPTIFTVLISTGSVASATVMQPSILFGMEIISTLIKNIILPLIMFYIVLAIVNNISTKFHISKLSEFIKSIGVWLIGILLTILIGIITLQSNVTSVADSVTIKTTKFAVSTFVPIVGKVLSDAVETVLGYSMMLKNGIAVFGMIAIIMICLVPIIKIFALMVIYRLTAALIQPISDERIVKCISEMANSLMFLWVIVISVAVMLLITSFIIMNAGIMLK